MNTGQSKMNADGAMQEEDNPIVLPEDDTQRGFKYEKENETEKIDSHVEETIEIQQEDNYKPFFEDIMRRGLQYTYESRKGLYHPHVHGKTANPKHVIIVGAGITGLAAAYELEQAGHKTTILELTNRVGGRVKTIYDFPECMHEEGGAMRIPPNHFLTWHYLNLFKIKTRPFKNKNLKGFLYLYGTKITLENWEKNNGKWTDKFWPGWDANINKSVKKQSKISGILDLYRETIRPVIEELIKNHSEKGWERWLNKWSTLSMLKFFRSDMHQNENGPKLRPWTEEAILAYKMSGYNILLDMSMADALREELGGWWQDELKTPEAGMSALPEAFIRANKNGWNKNVHLLDHIIFGVQVQAIEVGKNKQVKVMGRNAISGNNVFYYGDAVILTLPLTILRQLKLPLNNRQHEALAAVTYEPSTKVLLQFRKRFWHDSVGQGGFTITDRPIGQIKYPGFNGSRQTRDDRGILVSYTWGQDALSFGAQTSDQAVASALQQICEIHPEAGEYFEHGVMQAWFSDPGSQGAFASLRPFAYINNKKALTQPEHPIYLAGEAISWANGWIQGAIASALYIAYKFYKNNEDCACYEQDKY